MTTAREVTVREAIDQFIQDNPGISRDSVVWFVTEKLDEALDHHDLPTYDD